MNRLYKVSIASICATLGVAVCLAAVSTAANSAAYIKFDGVDGSVQVASHKGWVNVVSVSQITRKPGGGSQAPAETQVSDLVVVKQLDKSTPKLAEHCASGTFIGNATLEWIVDLPFAAGTAPQRDYLRYELKNVLITSYSIGAAEVPSMTGTSGGGSPLPHEELTLNFEEIKIEYTREDETGGVIDHDQTIIVNPARSRKD